MPSGVPASICSMPSGVFREADRSKPRSAVTLLLFLAALISGALNAVAGGGSFVTLPMLLYAGVPPVSANATSTFAVWPASIASAVAFRREIAPARKWLPLLGAISLVGGLIGGLLLVKTSDAWFLRLLPWLMLLSVATFTFAGRLRSKVQEGRPLELSTLALVVQFAIATYGGYFGGGMGIMMLGTFAASGMTDIHEMNGLKALLAVLINGVALVEFILNGAITWKPGFVMMAGGIVGGYAGATIARRLNRELVRTFIIVIGWTMTIYFFLR